VHPLYADDPGALDELKAIAERPKCVAFGELGLDQYYANPDQSIQMASLEGQLERISRWRKDGLAKPIVIHCRKATADLIPRLNDSGLPADQFVFHCFTGTPDEARAVLDFGAWISFTGVVTFQNAPEVARAASLVPNDRIMAETDAPFMTPAPHRNIKPNEPKFVVHVCEALAKIRGCTPQAMEELLDRNAEQFFGITLPDSPRAF
jgi:TatD DNase family protein